MKRTMVRVLGTILLAIAALSAVLLESAHAEPRTSGVPLAPTSLAQLDPVTGAEIPPGETIPGNRIRLQAVVADSDGGGSVRLEVQVLDRSDTWDAVPPGYEGSSPFYGTGSTAYVELGFEGENAFKWRARTGDPSGAVSEWTYFGGETDFVHLIQPEDAPPLAPVSLSQRDPATGAEIPLGGTSPGNSVQFEGVVLTTDGTGTVRLEVQVADVSETWDYGAPNNEASSALLAPGSLATAVTRFVGDNSLKWRARARNATGAVSEWVEFGDNGGGTDFVHYTVSETNRAPIADSGEDLVVEATSPTGASVSLDSSGSWDPDGDELTFSWTWESGEADGPAPEIALGLGLHEIELTATDVHGATSTDIVVVLVQDSVAPVISTLSASPDRLSTPNHAMMPVTISGSATDAADPSPSLKILSVASNEPVDGPGDGDTSVDWEVTGAMTLNLRAERSGTGSGRVYTVTVMAKDASGNSSVKAVEVLVPKGKK